MRESATSDPLGVHNEEDSASPCTCPETTRGTRTESPMSSLDIEPFMVESRQFWDQWRQEIWMVGDAGVENYVVRNVLSRLLYRGLIETCPYQKGGWHGYLKTLKKGLRRDEHRMSAQATTTCGDMLSSPTNARIPTTWYFGRLFRELFLMY
jgi:hypothetical protein